MPGDSDNLQRVAEGIKEAFTATASELKDLITKQDEEIRKHGETSTKTAQEIEKLDAKMRESAERQAALDKQIEELHKAGARGVVGGDTDPDSGKTLGQLFVESDEYRNMTEQKRAISERFEIAGRFDQFGRKDLLDLGASGTNLGIAAPYRMPDLVMAGMRRMRIRDLMNVVTLRGTDSVQYVRETGFSSLSARVAEAGVTGDTTLVVNNVSGFYAGQEIVIEGDDSDITREVESLNRATNTLTLTATLGQGVSVDAHVTSEILAGTPPTREKPDIDLEIALRTQAVVTVAGAVTVPRQSLADVNRLRNFIDTKVVYALQLAEEAHILYGDGSEEMMPGILNDEARQTLKWSDGPLETDTRIDAIRRAVTKVMLADYEPNGVVLHPNDWQEIELAKGSDRHYIWVTVTRGGVQQLWAMPVVATRAIADGTGVVGAWRLGGVLYDREQTSIRAFEQHADYAKRNLSLILGEQRATVTWERPESFCEVTFDQAPTA